MASANVMCALGATRLQRLHHIGSTSMYLAVDAYHLAISEAKHGKDIDLHRTLVDEFSQLCPDDPMAKPNLEWADKKEREVREEGEKLEHELRSYKNNLIKESIRVCIALQYPVIAKRLTIYQMGNEDLGHFYYARGDYAEAYRAYGRMREHCTSAKHLADMTLRLAFVSIAQKAWLGVQTHLAKLDTYQLTAEEKSKMESIVAACTGLAHMCHGNFADATNSFLKTSPNFMALEPAAGIYWQREVLTGNDVAVYGGLCALASMDRNELQSRVLGNSDFRNFLELEPHIRRAINLFCNNKYSACLETLEAYRTDYLLDLYLNAVVSKIYSLVRTKSIIQYFIPFSCVTLDEMASRFQPTEEYARIEDELEEMIKSGVLNARIDLVDRLLISPPTNARYSVHSDALTMAQRYEHTLQLRLTRLNMLHAGLTMQGDRGLSDRGHGLGGNQGILSNLGSRFNMS